jgi:hypothetical protein
MTSRSPDAAYAALNPLPKDVRDALIEVVQLASVVENDLDLMLAGVEITRETLDADRDGLRVALAKLDEVRRG